MNDHIKENDLYQQQKNEDDKTVISAEKIVEQVPLSNSNHEMHNVVSDSLKQNDENETNKLLKSKVAESDQENPIDEDQTQISSGAVLRNRFDLLEVLGHGGMGTVYKALDKRDVEAGNTKFIAIKIINDEYKDDSDLLKALHAEARKTQSLAHPNIVTVYDFDRDGNTVFMTMEYIEGIPLNQMLKSEPDGMNNNEVIHLVNQIGSALVYAHSQHIIHLDLKPSNIFVDVNKDVKVFDFGISRVTNIFQAKGFDPGVLGGLTPSYASLEMFQGKSPDPRDDIYALACMTYELLVGHHPFNKVRADIAKKKKLKPAKIKKLSTKQWKTLAKGLAFDRNDRIQSVELFLKGMAKPQRKKSSRVGLLAFLVLFPLGYFLYSQYRASSKLVIANGLSEEPVNKEGDSFKIAKPDNAEEQVSTKRQLSAMEESNNILLALNQQIFQIGNNLVFEFMVKKPRYVLIAVINSEKKLSMLFPNQFQLNNYCIAGVKYFVPPLDAEFNINIEGPGGIDQVIAMMSEQPISEDILLGSESLEDVKNVAFQNGLEYATTSYRILD